MLKPTDSDMFNSILFFIMISTAQADSPEFTIVTENQPAPFEGVLFNPAAAAEILAKTEEQIQKCDLEIEYQVDLAASQCKLDKDLLDARISTLDKELLNVREQKDLEIAMLQKIIKRQSPQYKWWWFAGGVVLGGATYYGIQQAGQ